MKGLFIITFTVLTLASCVDSSDRLNGMSSPVVLVGKSQSGVMCSQSGSILLKDGNGTLVAFDCYTEAARTIWHTYLVGDTIK